MSRPGTATAPAIIWDSPVTDNVETITYSELRDRTARLAGALARKGIGKGDRVVIYMPMVPEAVVAMLACARIGAIHSVVFGGFAANELAKRIDDARPKAVIAASCGIEPNRVVHYKPLLDGALELARHKPDFCVIFQRAQEVATLIHGRDQEWEAFQDGAEPAPCVPVEGDHPAYILYTSGTTGQPKGVVRPTAGHLVALDWSMENIYGVAPGEVFWAASDVGWVVGHSYIVYAPLVHGCTTIVFEGKPVGTPDAGTFWRVMQEHGVSAFFTAPTAFRAIKREDPKGELVANYDLSKLRTLFLAGERADPDTVEWAGRILDVPVIDHWWQTETGWTIAGNPIGLDPQPIKIGSPSVPMPGYDIQVLDEGGHPVAAPARSAPSRSGCRCRRARSPVSGTRRSATGKPISTTSPAITRPETRASSTRTGIVWIMARTDDVINVAGHRLSTGAMEEVLAAHPDIAECAVIGVADPLKGQLPMGLVCLNKDHGRDESEVAREAVKLIRDKIGPVAAFQPRLGDRPAPQDPIRQDPAGDDGEDRGWRGRRAAGHDR